ncbi:probable polygalacturonase At3g15720 [Salvia hispanica]|uniref:probable polygalacturonase At3g15720 n=1 Tax=Salvia hispanica TaxID=49212 RepID=UPI0020091427|nr:probable polygalacturonase At3g15720 [Salvia hispanica]
MDYHHVTLLFMLLSCIASCAFGATNIFNVLSYGAVGNGRADDSQAFLKAWNAACQGQAKSGVTPVVYAPAKKTFLLDPLTFKGPCKSSRIYMLVSGNMVAPVKTAWSGKQVEGWILFTSVNGLVIKGKGVFDGKGASWWPSRPCYNDPARGVLCKGPAGMIFRRCHGLRLDGFTKINGPGSHMVIMSTHDVVVSNLVIIAPGDSPNTDAIDISGSTKVQVRNSFIATGDDCIAITAGSSNIDISGITCGPGHGISIGSLGGGGFDVVENVRVRNCTLKNTITGVRIKTVQGGTGYARKISFQGIKFEAVDNPIEIEQFYCPLKQNCKNDTSGVAISDVTFSAISGTSIAENVISLKCSQINACKNVRLDRVYIKSTTPNKKVSAVCFNAHGTATHTKPAVKCLLP